MAITQNKVVLVTGATGAIGKAIARQLATRQGYGVVLAGRDEGKTKWVTKQISYITGNEYVCHEIVDVSDYGSICALAERWKAPLHILINNAAITPRRRQETSDGIELQFATNVLGYFWMVEAFHDILKKSAPARVINVASYWAGDLDLNDLEFEKRHYNNNRAYRQSKQANRMLTVALAERLKSDNIAVNACHPGDVSSKLSNSLGFGGHQSPDEGARTPVWLATSSIGQQKTGQYFEQMKAVPCRFSTDREAVEKLYRTCQQYTNK